MPTPELSEYVAGHGLFASSQAEVYAQFFGTNQIERPCGWHGQYPLTGAATAGDLRQESSPGRAACTFDVHPAGHASGSGW